ncbi:MAG TPA: SDR family oxidoreductase [Chloroflexota bacterium]|jgi:3-oxoacyl-[acyl-carrier protein] reductase|nr:SDR family oxidoreductase [Chloroflexota bacterium]
MDLSGQVAIITGAGRGLGRAIALRLADAGAAVVAAARTAADLDTLVADITSRGGRALAVVADVSVDTQAQQLADAAAAAFGGRVDVLVNNAGWTFRRPVTDIGTSDWLTTLAVNLSSTFYCTRAIAPLMVARGGGKIINISSTGGRRGGAQGAAYSAAKFGVLGLGEAAAHDLKDVGITVSAVLPGPTATPARARNAPDEDPRTALQPADVAEVVLFLATRPPNVIIPEITIIPRKML